LGAIIVNLTATEPTAAGFSTLWATGSPLPPTSNLNFVPNLTVPNLVISQLSTDGMVSFFNSAGQTNFIVDVIGWFPPNSELTTLTPARILDTRPGLKTIDGQFQAIGAIEAAKQLDLPVLGRGGVPGSGVGAVILNVTATEPTAAAYLTIWPFDAARPLTSSLNVVPQQTVANLVIATVGADGKVSIFNSAGSTHVVADVMGWLPALQ
jgi:hypothetical protein